jgi:hypothetical protein
VVLAGTGRDESHRPGHPASRPSPGQLAHIHAVLAATTPYTGNRSAVGSLHIPLCGKRVRGRLGETLLGAFPELRPQMLGSGTLLAGQLPDQAAIFGVLDRVEAFGLEPCRSFTGRPPI